MGWHTRWAVDVRKHGPKNLADAADIVWREIPYRPYKFSSGMEGYEARVGSPYLEVKVKGDPKRKERDIGICTPIKKYDYSLLRQFLEAILKLEPKLSHEITYECGLPIDSYGKFYLFDRYHRTVTITRSLAKANKEEVIRKGILRPSKVVYSRDTSITVTDTSDILDELFFSSFEENLDEERKYLGVRISKELLEEHMECEPIHSTVSLQGEQGSRISSVDICPTILGHRFDLLLMKLASVTVEDYEAHKADLENAVNLLSKIDMQNHWFDVWGVGSEEDRRGKLLYYLGRPFERLSRKKEEITETAGKIVQEEIVVEAR